MDNPYPGRDQVTQWALVHDDSAVQAVIEQALADPRLYASTVAMPGAAAALAELDRHHDVFIVTSPDLRNPGCLPGKVDTIAREFGHRWLERCMFTADKTVIDADVLIDDRPVIRGTEPRPSWRQLLFGAERYNAAVPGTMRAADWDAALRLLRSVRWTSRPDNALHVPRHLG